MRIAVLAGGRGARLDGAKPVAPLAGRPLIKHVLDASRATGLPLLVVAKRATPLPALDEQVVLEPDAPHHPLVGVIAALRALPAGEDRVLAVGCDMPFVTAQLLLALAAGGGSAALECDGRLQPLPACYPLSALDALQRSLATQRPLREALAGLRPTVIAQPQLRALGDAARLLFNVNDDDSLGEAERLLSHPPPPRARPPRPARRG